MTVMRTGTSIRGWKLELGIGLVASLLPLAIISIYSYRWMFPYPGAFMVSEPQRNKRKVKLC